MKSQKSLTPRSTDVGPVNYSTLSNGSVMKIPMMSFRGFLPRNSTTPKISFLTFIPLILTNPDPYLVYNLLPQFPDPFRYFLSKTVVKSYILPILPIFSPNPSAFQENMIFYIQTKFFTRQFYSTILSSTSASSSPSASASRFSSVSSVSFAYHLSSIISSIPSKHTAIFRKTRSIDPSLAST